MICLTSPGNPTGCVIPEEELQKIASLAIEKTIRSALANLMQNEEIVS